MDRPFPLHGHIVANIITSGAHDEAIKAQHSLFCLSVEWHVPVSRVRYTYRPMCNTVS